MWLLELSAFLSCVLIDVLWMRAALHYAPITRNGSPRWEEKNVCCRIVSSSCLLLSGSQEESHLAWELENPTGISVASHRFVSMAFDCPSWMSFHALWFPFQPVPVDRCEPISASTVASAARTRTAGSLSTNGNSNACLLFSPNRKIHFPHFTQLRHMDSICFSISAKSSQCQLV